MPKLKAPHPLLTLALLSGLTAAASAQTFPSESPPRVIEKVSPSYTKEAFEAKLEGIVVLAFTIEIDGTPSGIQVLRSLGKGLDEKAIQCLEQWRFTPARSGMGPIRSKASVEIDFRLPQSQPPAADPK